MTLSDQIGGGIARLINMGLGYINVRLKRWFKEYRAEIIHSYQGRPA